MLYLNESLMYFITVWYGSCTMERLYRVVKTAQIIIGCPLLSLVDIYTSHCLSIAKTIIKDSYHQGFELFYLLPSGRQYKCINTEIFRLEKQLSPKTIPIKNNLNQLLSIPRGGPWQKEECLLNLQDYFDKQKLNGSKNHNLELSYFKM